MTTLSSMASRAVPVRNAVADLIAANALELIQQSGFAEYYDPLLGGLRAREFHLDRTMGWSSLAFSTAPSMQACIAAENQRPPDLGRRAYKPRRRFPPPPPPPPHVTGDYYRFAPTSTSYSESPHRDGPDVNIADAPHVAGDISE